jgi:hypothetical protein
MVDSSVVTERGRAKRELPASWLPTEENTHRAPFKSPSDCQSQRSSKSSESTPPSKSQLCDDTSSAQEPGSAVGSDVSAAGCHGSTVQGSATSILHRLIAAGRGQDALQLLTELQHNPKLSSVEVDVCRGHVFLSLARPSEASACFLAALSEHPQNEQALCALGRIHHNNGDMMSSYEVCSPTLAWCMFWVDMTQEEKVFVSHSNRNLYVCGFRCSSKKFKCSVSGTRGRLQCHHQRFDCVVVLQDVQAENR